MSMIMASPTDLLRQASTTADDYLRNAISNIDKLLGEGYAAKHPELVGAFMRTAAADFHTAISTKALEELTAVISEASHELGEIATALAKEE